MFAVVNMLQNYGTIGADKWFPQWDKALINFDHVQYIHAIKLTDTITATRLIYENGTGEAVIRESFEWARETLI